MKNITSKIVFLLMGFLFLTSCVLDQDETNFGEGPKVVQFSSSSTTGSFVQKGTGETTDYNIVVQSFGGDNLPSSQPVPVSVTVAVAANSQLKEGNEFTIVNKTITIPAGESSANIVVKVAADKIPVGAAKTLILDIVDASQTISNNRGQITAALSTICESNLAGEYVYTVGTLKDVTISKDGTTPGKYKINRDAFYNSDYAFNFSDNCGVLTVTGGVLSAANAQSGTGTVNSVTGDITFSYSIAGTAVQNRTMTLKKK